MGKILNALENIYGYAIGAVVLFVAYDILTNMELVKNLAIAFGAMFLVFLIAVIAEKIKQGTAVFVIFGFGLIFTIWFLVTGGEITEDMRSLKAYK